MCRATAPRRSVEALVAADLLETADAISGADETAMDAGVVVCKLR